MLFLPPGTSKLVRAQGAMTTDEEIRSIVDFIKEQGAAGLRDGDQGEAREDGRRSRASTTDGEDDELLAQAVEIIRETRRASTSSLQRRLRIGYTRAGAHDGHPRRARHRRPAARLGPAGNPY